MSCDDVKRAYEVLKSVANVTPAVSSQNFNKEIGAEVFLKCENMQITNAFKFRGGYYALHQLTDAEKKAGVVAISTGNMGIALSLAGKMLGVPVTMIMPDDSPVYKQDQVRSNGANLINFNRYEVDSATIIDELKVKNPELVVVNSSNPNVIAGQGTIAYELFEQVGKLDYLFFCVGYGSNLSGATLVAQEKNPDC